MNIRCNAYNRKGLAPRTDNFAYIESCCSRTNITTMEK